MTASLGLTSQLDQEKDCNTCKHHKQGQSIDDASPRCWDCVGQMDHKKLNYLPYWEPIDAKESLEMGRMKEALLTAREMADPYELQSETTINKTKPDMVNHPPHYIEGRKYEPANVIMDWQLTWCLGNAVKYISRAGRKGSKREDLEKAIWYLKFELDYGTK